jgi:GT2 family glycosyltransferase
MPSGEAKTFGAASSGVAHRSPQRPAPPVGIVILNWHGRNKTHRCLGALAQLTYPRFFVVLVDNGCGDFDLAGVTGFGTASRYLRTEENLGFAGGANLGMREALAAGAEYVWFLNNDAYPEAAALDELVVAIEAPDRIAVAGAKILLAGDHSRLDSLALYVDTRSGRIYLQGHGEIDAGQYDHLADVTAVTGCAMLVTRSACERLGGFDETFFAYLEDADLCMRAHAAGLRVVAAPRSRVRHDRPMSTAARQSVASIYYTTRNHLMLMHRYGSGGVARRLLRPATIVALNLVYAIRAGGPPLRTRVAAVLRGVADARRGISGKSREADRK